MRGLITLLLVIVAVSTVRSQRGPPTRTKSGPPPSRRRSDNTDVGLPSGKDVPDGRRFPYGPPPPAAPKIARPVPKRAAPPKKVAKAPAKVLRRLARPGDNPDFGMPSGKDVPDGRRFVAPPPAKLPAPKRITRLRAGKRPRFMPPVVPRRFVPAAPPAALPPMGVPVPPPVFSYSPFAPPAAPYAPPAAQACNCAYTYNSYVCSTSGDEYDNECMLQCSGAALGCNHACPCYPAAAPPPAPVAPLPIDDCSCPGPQNSPVCGTNGEIYDSSCLANCEGQAVGCEGTCPCDT